MMIQLIADAGAVLLILLIATILSVCKPWGGTSYGSRKQFEKNKRVLAGESATRNPWVLYVLLGLICLVVLLFVVLRLIRGGLGGH